MDLEDAEAMPMMVSDVTDVERGTREGVSPREQVLAAIPLEDRRVEAAGISTAVLEGGEGPPVVLLHGPGEFAGTWTRVIPHVVSEHRVIVPDLPGQGASKILRGALDRPRVLDWLQDLLGQTCSEVPALAGHLLGGAIALRYVTDRRGPVSRLVLVDTFGLGPLRPSPAFALSMVGFLARPTVRTQERLFRRCFVDLDSLRSDMDGGLEVLEAYALDRARDPEVKEALKRLMKEFGGAIPDEDLAAVSVPTSLIWGRHDLQVKLPVAEKASRRFGWPLHVIEDAADDPAVEQPEAFVRALRRALDVDTGRPAQVTNTQEG